jgi:hypothetical protein
MGYQIIRQPDGRLALFSSHADSWAAWDMTPEEVREWFAARPPCSPAEVDRKLELVLAGQADEAYGRTWAMTFAEAQAHSWHHGGEVLNGPVAEELLVELERPLDGDLDDAEPC